MKLHTLKEAAAILNISYRHLTRQIDKGHITPVNVSPGAKRPTLRITQEALDDFLKRGKE